MTEDPRIEAVAQLIFDEQWVPIGPSAYDAAKMILAAADAAAWRPIEEAPRDMTRIDLWHEVFGRVTGAFWKNGRWCENCGAKPSSGLDYGIGYQTRITHFMPIPAPPKETKS